MQKIPEHIQNRKYSPAPTVEEVCTYLEEFIEEKDIRHKFKFDQRIEDIRKNADNEWFIEFYDGKVEAFSYVIICTGIVSVKPKIIDIPGREQFEWNGGEIIHSSQRRDDAWFKGQKVLVIENGKSAVDAVSIAARNVKDNGTKPPIQAARRATWYVPRYLGTILRVLSTSRSLLQTKSTCKSSRKREIDMLIATVERLEPRKAFLSTGAEEEVDVIVMATGWELGFDTFMDKHSVLDNLLESDGMWLYRNVLPTNLKGVAFVGPHTLSFMNIYTSYIQAYWLAGFMSKERPWPKRAHMEETIRCEEAFKRKYYPEHVLRGASVEAYMQHYHDVLFREMGARKPFNSLIRPMADLLVPMVPFVMKGMLEPTKEKRKKLKMRKKSRDPNRPEQARPAKTMIKI